MPIGPQEIAVLFLLALLFFGPKELPQLGRTLGKAITEFRRAQSELTSTFQREMKNIERETGIKELTATDYHSDSYSYESSAYDSFYDENGNYSGSHDPHAVTGASAIEGAGATEPLQIEAASGSIASGHMDSLHNPGAAEAAHYADEHNPYGEPAAPAHGEAPHPSAEAGKPVTS